MQLLIKERILKDWQQDKQHRLLQQIFNFRDELNRVKFDIHQMARGFWVRKMKAGSGHDVFKFRLNNGDRVLFTYYSEIVDDPRPEFRDALLIFDVCHHDRQNRSAREHDLNGPGWLPLEIERSEYTAEEEQTESHFTVAVYDLEKASTCIVDEENLVKLHDSSYEGKYLHYLSREQFECLDEQQPVILSGSAGSGKTTVGVHRLISIADRVVRPAYFTYTSFLRDSARLIFNLGAGESAGNVEFNDISGFCRELLQNNHYRVSEPVRLPRFIKWYEKIREFYPKLQNRSGVEIWSELRGIVKGFMGEDWLRNRLFKGADLPDKRVRDLLEQQGIIQLLDIGAYYLEDPRRFRPDLPELAQLFPDQVIPAEVGRLIERLRSKMFNAVPDNPLLDEESYLRVKHKTSYFNETERLEMHRLARQYQSWLEENDLQDENDYARMVLRLINDKRVKPISAMVIDEVQDLTQLQIWMFYRLLENPSKLFVSGDFHQIINPNYFRFENLKSLLWLNGVKFSERRLERNYRSQKCIVALANLMARIRTEYIGKDGNDYLESGIKEGEKPLLIHDRELGDWIIENLGRRHYAAIVVSDYVTREQLLRRFGDAIRIFTVQEIKGLEYHYVFCYNLLSDFRDEWQEIVAEQGKRQTHYRYFFNLFYVSITRARQVLAVFESDKNHPLLAKISGMFDRTADKATIEATFEVQSSAEDWEADGERLEKLGKYRQAIESYRKAQTATAQHKISRCEALLLQEEGNNRDAGEILLELQEYNLALRAFDTPDTADRSKQLELILQNNLMDARQLEEYFRKREIHPLHLIFSGGIESESVVDLSLDYQTLCGEQIAADWQGRNLLHYAVSEENTILADLAVDDMPGAINGQAWPVILEQSEVETKIMPQLNNNRQLKQQGTADWFTENFYSPHTGKYYWMKNIHRLQSLDELNGGRVHYESILKLLGRDFGQTPLMAAVEKGLVGLVDLFLDRGGDPHMQTLQGYDLLYAAVVSGKEQVIARLLQDHITAHTYQNGITLLHLAVQFKQPQVFRLLIQSGFDPSEPDNTGSTPLHYAVRYGDEAVFAEVVAAAPQQQPDKNGELPLHLAVRENHTAFAGRLCNDNSLQTANQRQEVPLVLALERGNTEMLKQLFSCNGAVSWQSDEAHRLIRDKLFYRGDIELFSLFFEHGFPVHHPAYVRWEELLCSMAVAGKSADVGYLLRAKVDPLFKSAARSEYAEERLSAPNLLSAALQSNDLQTVKTVNKHTRFDAAESDAQGNTVHHLAAAVEDKRIFAYIHKAYHISNQPNSNGETPMIIALKHRKWNRAWEMLNKGGELHLDWHDSTPEKIGRLRSQLWHSVCRALSSHQDKLIERLIKNGLDRFWDGETLLHYGVTAGSIQPVKQLIKLGAEPLVRSGKFSVPAAAVRSGNVKFLTYLKNNPALYRIEDIRGAVKMACDRESHRALQILFDIEYNTAQNQEQQKDFKPVFYSRYGARKLVTLCEEWNLQLLKTITAAIEGRWQRSLFMLLFDEEIHRTASVEQWQQLVRFLSKGGADVNWRDGDFSVLFRGYRVLSTEKFNILLELNPLLNLDLAGDRELLNELLQKGEQPVVSISGRAEYRFELDLHKLEIKTPFPAEIDPGMPVYQRLSEMVKIYSGESA